MFSMDFEEKGRLASNKIEMNWSYWQVHLTGAKNLKLSLESGKIVPICSFIR